MGCDVDARELSARGDASPPPHASGVLTSRIGRRFVLLFTGCALLPLLAFAWLALRAASERVRSDLRTSLHEGAKTAGMGIAARLSQVAGDLALAAEWAQRWSANAAAGEGSLGRHVGERCDAVWLLQDDHVQSLAGMPPTPLAPWSPTERAHLATGKPLVRLVGSPPQLLLVRAVDPKVLEQGQVVASVRSTWFWDPDELRVPGSEVAVYDHDWRLLFHTFLAAPPSEPLVASAATNSASGSVEWTPDDEPHLARYWRAFLRPQYGGDMFVVQSRRLHDALAVSDSFRRTLLLTAACTLLLVAFASLVQMRRTLGPIVALRDATRRVAQGDLAVRVPLRSTDEFGDLAAAFDHMTSRLRETVRIREQAERELVASRDAALAAAHAKAEFVTNVSHEFRTPMTEILGAAEILAQRDGLDDGVRLEFAGIALRGAQRLAELIDDVLEFGANTEWAMGPVDVVGTLHEALAGLAGPVRQRVALTVDGGLPPVRGEAARLTEVWGRLLDNAAKFSEAGQPIELRAMAHAGEVVVEVVDRGVGVSRVDLARIFEPFCQVGRDQLTDKAHGTGLGLSLAKKAVERHGGRIEVESELGNGATFRVRLPALAVTKGPSPSPSPSPPVPIAVGR